ncbi:hypothetical protein BJ875DRAFT_445857 [Amylocarpus encephaloides]|uniref:Uncharacterized protein n=1 Tax=Amylocarpus encephaloides TaxID=45428 RepID=A0A9P7Y9W1_9HELO|nr:hypothetical protein BJ875DRAFT_445857 [Amylocarpus encephaloides]
MHDRGGFAFALDSSDLESPSPSPRLGHGDIRSTSHRLLAFTVGLARGDAQLPTSKAPKSQERHTTERVRKDIQRRKVDTVKSEQTAQTWAGNTSIPRSTAGLSEIHGKKELAYSEDHVPTFVRVRRITASCDSQAVNPTVQPRSEDFQHTFRHCNFDTSPSARDPSWWVSPHRLARRWDEQELGVEKEAGSRHQGERGRFVRGRSSRDNVGASETINGT